MGSVTERTALAGAGGERKRAAVAHRAWCNLRTLSSLHQPWSLKTHVTFIGLWDSCVPGVSNKILVRVRRVTPRSVHTVPRSILICIL